MTPPASPRSRKWQHLRNAHERTSVGAVREPPPSRSSGTLTPPSPPALAGPHTHPRSRTLPSSFPPSREPRAGARHRGVSVSRRTPHPYRLTGESRYPEGRRAGHPHPQPHRIPYSPSQGRFPSPFALSLSKPVLRALEGGPPPPSAPAAPHTPTRVIPAKAGIQRCVERGPFILRNIEGFHERIGRQRWR